MAVKAKAAKPPTPLPVSWGAATPRQVQALYRLLAKHIRPESDLHFSTTFELLVAVVLSAQTTDKAVNQATAPLFKRAPGPAEMLALGEEGLIPYLRHIGLYRAKAKHVIGLCRQLIERHGGSVPDNRAELEALPGVGRKTANVVLNIAFGQPTIAVDTHVHRVANRLGICATTKVEDTENVLLARTPPAHRQQAHHYLLLHGRYTCLARQPRCSGCPLARLCPSCESPA
ncbi:MAG: endonuclease III [Planctomycetota bacterium]|nr:MAG: endonuclease III [Planctomycetota bacterium]